MFTVRDQMLQCPPRPLPMDRKWKSNVELAPNCPRCASANTKFCYYNNYSLSQPRYFCKACRRYWTKGGSLRNVPVGGGCRKSRRAKSSSSRVVDRTAQLPMNYSCKSFSSSPDDHGESGNQPAAGADIDLAVVFAKFLNQSSTSFDNQIVTADQRLPNEGVDVWSSLEQDTNSSQNDISSIQDQSYMLQDMPQIKQQLHENSSTAIQEMLETDHVNAFGLPNLLADDDIEQDALWSDHDHAATTTTPNFEWQPMLHLQQTDQSFPVVDDYDQLKISANLMTENWSYFDLSGFGLFSKP